MMPVDFATLAHQCSPGVHPSTLQAVVRTESGFNPYAIGVVGGRLVRQPSTQAEALATARALEAGGWNYSMGLAQVNRANLRAYGLTSDAAFDPCANLRVGSAILSDCYARALAAGLAMQHAVGAALSCYYSGNFTRGFKVDARGTSYVQRVVANAAPQPASVPAVPAIQVVPEPSARGASVRRTPRKWSPARPPSDSEPVDTRSANHPAWDVLGDF